MNQDKVEIILIEDNPDDAELIKRVFKKNNLSDQFLILKDGAEALDFFSAHGKNLSYNFNHHPRVILLDLKLPKVDGIEVLRNIKMNERMKSVPVVILTSSTEERDLKNAYDLGVNSYVTKPIRHDEFASIVSQLGSYWLTVNRLST